MYGSQFVLDTPRARENIRRRYAAPLHRTLTSPPSLWPGRELRKYHYPCVSHGQVGNNPALAGFGFIARSETEVVALRLPWLVNNRNVPDAWIFSFQSALSCEALRKPNLHIPCGEIVLSPYNGHFGELF